MSCFCCDGPNDNGYRYCDACRRIGPGHTAVRLLGYWLIEFGVVALRDLAAEVAQWRHVSKMSENSVALCGARSELGRLMARTNAWRKK